MIHDLLYLGTRENMDTASAAIRAAFPTAVLEEDWDDIHDWRLDVDVPDATPDQWAVWILKEGLGTTSLDIAFALYVDTVRLKGWLEAAGIDTSSATAEATPEAAG